MNHSLHSVLNPLFLFELCWLAPIACVDRCIIQFDVTVPPCHDIQSHHCFYALGIHLFNRRFSSDEISNCHSLPNDDDDVLMYMNAYMRSLRASYIICFTQTHTHNVWAHERILTGKSQCSLIMI